MAAAAHFSARIYGQVEGNAPFQDGNGAASFSRIKPFPTALVNSFPTAGVNIWALSNGVQMPAGQYVYSVIEVLPSGLNVHSDKYVSDQSAATLATNAG